MSEKQKVKASLEAIVTKYENLQLPCSLLERDISSLRGISDCLEGRLEGGGPRGGGHRPLEPHVLQSWCHGGEEGHPGSLPGGCLTEAVTAAGREEERLALLFGERDHTFVRFGRGKQFRSRKERDKWTEQELGQVWAQLEEKTLHLQELKRFVETVWAGPRQCRQCRAVQGRGSSASPP